VTRRLRAAGALLSLVILLQGCAVHLVADYDQQSEDRLITSYEKICRFYDDLSSATPEARAYEGFRERYPEIDTDLRVLLLRQKVRAKNDESVQITAKILEAWEVTRDRHARYSIDPDRANDPYPESLIRFDRAQFDAHFQAAVAAERAKK
jgi:hypothetical protein